MRAFVCSPVRAFARTAAAAATASAFDLVLHGIEEPTFTGSEFAVVLEDVAFCHTREDNITDAFLVEELVDEFVHVRERIST